MLQTLLKSLYNAYTLLLVGNSLDNSNMVMLSMEPRKRIIMHPLQNFLTFIQSAVDILFDSRNAATAWKLNVACVTIVLK